MAELRNSANEAAGLMFCGQYGWDRLTPEGGVLRGNDVLDDVASLLAKRCPAPPGAVGTEAGLAPDHCKPELLFGKIVRRFDAFVVDEGKERIEQLEHLGTCASDGRTYALPHGEQALHLEPDRSHRSPEGLARDGAIANSVPETKDELSLIRGTSSGRVTVVTVSHPGQLWLWQRCSVVSGTTGGPR